MEQATRRQVTKSMEGSWQTVADSLVTEAPMEIRLGGVPLAVLMRTPGDERDLILGFAITEGMVLGPHEVERIEAVPEAEGDDRWELVLNVEVDPAQFQRNTYTTSSCGVCGKASIDAVRVTSPHPPNGPRLSPRVLLGMAVEMRNAQTTFEETGGLHAAAAFDARGELMGIREDIGRHNAVDKLVGALSSEKWPLGELVLMVSGRVSFEMVQKAAVAGIPVICGVSAASSLAAELADELGLTVIGFLRDAGFNIYADQGRINRSVS